jgi:hypothetical protein
MSLLKSKTMIFLALPMLIGLTFGTAARAEKKETRVANGLTASQFVQNCESMGGEIDDSSQGPEGVSCTLPSGTSADCSFGPKDAYCEVTTPGRSMPTRVVKGLIGESALGVVKQ